MSIRTFLFCDMCNPDAIRTVDTRRNGTRAVNGGRRRDDGRAWYEGSPVEARAQGWTENGDGSHLCPDCRQRLSGWPDQRLGHFHLRLVS